jgi:competence protein ComEA
VPSSGTAGGSTAGDGAGWLPDDAVFEELEAPAGAGPGRLRLGGPGRVDPGAIGPGVVGSARSSAGGRWLAAGVRRLVGRMSGGGVSVRVDPGRRAAVAVVGVGVLVALAVAVLTWHGRPAAVPVEPMPAVAGAATPGSGPLVTAGAAAGGPALAGSAAGGGTAASTPGTIVVAVAGRVRRPGVVTLPAGARVVDAIRAAGGALPGSDLGLLNLARRLADGDLVAVGVPGATDPGGAGPVAAGSGGPAGAAPEAGGPLVNLNTATAEQLDALPGVGPVLAQRIVEFRAAHGRFDSVDQLRDVSGIGDSKFAQLRGRVTV